MLRALVTWPGTLYAPWLCWYVPNTYALHCPALQTFETNLSRKKCDKNDAGNRLSRNTPVQDGGGATLGIAAEGLERVEDKRLSPLAGLSAGRRRRRQGRPATDPIGRPTIATNRSDWHYSLLRSTRRHLTTGWISCQAKNTGILSDATLEYRYSRAFLRSSSRFGWRSPERRLESWQGVPLLASRNGMRQERLPNEQETR
jgi:hypothetical protein